MRRDAQRARHLDQDADARARRRQLAHCQQGQAGSLALFLRRLPGGLRQRAAQTHRLLLYAARSRERDGQSGGRGIARSVVRAFERIRCRPM